LRATRGVQIDAGDVLSNAEDVKNMAGALEKLATLK